MATDPICGMEVDESTTLKVEQGKQVIYFCSEHCRKKFLGESSPEPAARPSKAYYCPMCPGVESDGPGACPKCGMALERNPALPGAGDENSELRDMVKRFWVSLVLGLPIVALAMGGMLFDFKRWLPQGASQWIQLFLSTPVVLWCGWPFFVRGWRSLVTGKLNMFTLVGMGIGTAYFYSLIATLFPRLFPDSFRAGGEVAVYFEAAAMITVLVLLGQVLELRARERTGGGYQVSSGAGPEYRPCPS